MCSECSFWIAEVKDEEVRTGYARSYGTQEQWAWNDDMASVVKTLLVGIDQTPIVYYWTAFSRH